MSSEMKNAMVGAVVGDIAGSRFESLVYEGWGIMTSMRLMVLEILFVATLSVLLCGCNRQQDPASKQMHQDGFHHGH